MNTVHKRLLKELADSSKLGPESVVELSTTNDNLFVWQALCSPEKDSSYHGMKLELRLQIPSNYPISPPHAKMITKICHPNIHTKTGEICLDILKTEWSPAWTLQSLCMAILVLIDHPEIDSPLNCDAANLLRCKDDLGYKYLVKYYKGLAQLGEKD